MSKKKKEKKKEKEEGGPVYNKKTLTKAIITILSAEPSLSFNYKQVAKKLGITKSSTKQLISVVFYELANDGIVRENYTGKFQIRIKSDYSQGVIAMNRNGTAELETDDNRTVYISERNLNHALHGDTVRVAVTLSRRTKQLEGEVVEIVERAKRTFVGTIALQPNFAFLLPDNKLMPYDIFIPRESLKGARDGQKVIARITDWPANVKNPNGEVIEVLGDPGVHEVEMHAILAEFELPYRFPEELEVLAGKISDKITATDYKERRDFRGIPTFTIDPVDAKDFDDALSFRKLDNGNYEVGVHIADVTHYVRPGSPIDNEAIERGTSVYLVDRCVPMLPEQLSNVVCSLRPDEEKLCFSAVFEIDENANVLNEWFGRTEILSTRRFTYEEAQQVIETGEGDMLTEILTLHRLAQDFRKKRFKSGAIAFDRVEVKFRLDEKGKPLGVFFKEQKESNQLIEEFMLLANKRVAEFIGTKGTEKSPLPFVYRIHDKPNLEKFDNFRQFITRFGYNIEGSTEKQISKSLNKLLSGLKGKKEQNLIETLAVRSMAKARYSTDNIGHYGLSFPNYTHFTSPIRRFPDMMVHRLLAHYLDGGKPKDAEALEKLCKHSSEMEIKASEAERASIKYKQVEYMQDKIGEVFDGVISGVTDFGMFVELTESKCEGLVAMRDLDDDFYAFDEQNYCLVGRQTNRKFQLGDEVQVVVHRTNLALKQLDFKLAGTSQLEPNENARPPRRSFGGPSRPAQSSRGGFGGGGRRSSGKGSDKGYGKSSDKSRGGKRRKK